MKILKFGLLSLFALFLVTSCEEDPLGGGGTGGPGTGGGGGTVDDGPEIAFLSEAGSLTSDTKLTACDIFTVTLTAAKGSTDLNSLTIEQDGVRIEDFATRVTINGEPIPSAALLLPNNPDAFTTNIAIKAQADNRKSIYKFTVADMNGNTAFVDIEIDTEGTTSGTVEPTITLMGSGEVIADAGTLVQIPIEGKAGSDALQTISVFVDGDPDLVPVPADRLYYGEISAAGQFTDNPYTIPTEDQESFTRDIYIRAQDGQSKENYIIAISDGVNDPVFVEVVINTFPGGVEGNPLGLRMGVLLNAAGPAGTGGLDLDSGAGTGSRDENAEIKDNGIDTDLGPANNWLQRISGVNGTTLKQLVPNTNGLSESFSFDALELDTQLRDIWGNGVEFAGVNDSGEPWSETVQVGDIFIAENSGKYYALLVTNIDVNPETNGDSYTFDIKYEL